MTDLRDLLCTLVAEGAPEDDVALLLSGGVDSLSLGFAATALGKRVSAYTFQVGEWESTDAKTAARAAAEFGWEFRLVKVPLDHLERDFLELAERWGCVKKTQFECSWPFLYLIPEIRERYVLSGIAADGHFGLSKKAMIHFRYPKASFDAFRERYFSSANPAGQLQQKAICESFGRIQVAPYLDRRTFDFFLRYDWDQINRPQQKWLTLTAFPEFFKRCSVRRHANLQLVAGVDRIFETLLRSSLNLKGRTRVMDLCRDYAKASPPEGDVADD